MFESLTFLSVVSALPATLKFAYDGVDFYAKVKALRSPAPPRPLVQSESLTRLERNELSKMYAGIEKCRPVAADIATRSLRFYLVVAGVLVAFLIAMSLLLMLIPTPAWLLAGMVATAGAGFLAIRRMPSPIPDVIPHLNETRVRTDIEGRIRRLDVAWESMRSGSYVSVRVGGVSIPERVFLEVFTQADAIVRVLECDLLTRELRSGIRAAHETLTGRVFEVGSEIVAKLAREGRLDNPENRQSVLAAEFRTAGLPDLVSPELVGVEFFSAVFRALTEKGKLIPHLKQVWSSER